MVEDLHTASVTVKLLCDTVEVSKSGYYAWTKRSVCERATENEWTQMRMHPQYGLKILNEQPSISEAIKAACYEHHESWTGGGYPQDLSGQEIHPFGRIVALTDTYDAVTTQRSYNTPMSPSEALNMMKNKLSGRFDPEMLKAMYSVLFKMRAA